MFMVVLEYYSSAKHCLNPNPIQYESSMNLKNKINHIFRCDKIEQLCNQDKQKRKETQIRVVHQRCVGYIHGQKTENNCIQIVRLQNYMTYFYINGHMCDELGPIRQLGLKQKHSIARPPFG